MKHNYSGKYIVITGASLGLGRAIADKFASLGCHLVLLSLPQEGLPDYCNELADTYGVSIFHYETDLREGSNICAFVDWVSSLNLDIAGLVNNAGLGGSSFFEKTEIEVIDTMILVNIRALTLLTRLFIPELKKKERSFILNVSSIAAFKPMPFKTVYPASKSYVYSFSVGLSEELRKTGVQVSVLHPGPMGTSKENSTRLNKHGLMGKLALLEVEEVAEISVQQLLLGKKVIVPGMYNKICIRLLKTIPSRWAMPILSKVLKKETVEKIKQPKV